MFILKEGAQAPSSSRHVHSLLHHFVPCAFEGGKQNFIPVEQVTKLPGNSDTRDLHGKIAPSLGKLISGERYFVARVLLYIVGYNISTVSQASMEVIYCVVLNAGIDFIGSPSLIRILSSATCGTSPFHVLEILKEDFITGKDVDAEGCPYVLFIDCVGIIGDYPAIAKGLDVGGHNAFATCHIWRYVRRANTEVGSRYGQIHRVGETSAMSRSLDRHECISDCKPSEKTLKLLEISKDKKRQTSSLQVLARALFEIRANVQKD